MLFVPATGTGGDAIQELVNRVDARYAQLGDLQADFVQETRIEGFDKVLRSSGRVFLKKPGLLRWDFLEPSVDTSMCMRIGWKCMCPSIIRCYGAISP